jgi:hypothetical protein
LRSATFGPHFTTTGDLRAFYFRRTIMAERLSTGFVNAVNVTGSVKSLMADGIVAIYSGTQPTTADDTESGTLLMLLTLNSGAFTPGVATNGLNMDVSVAGVLAKAVAEVWSGLGLAAAGTGTVAGWFRWYDNDMVTGASTTAVRVDGSIGTTTAYELRMSNTTIVENGPSTVSTFTYTTPKA